MRECEYCGRSIVRKNAQAKYCSDKCRNYDRRRKLSTPFPAGMMNRARWVRWDIVFRKGEWAKVPLTVDGDFASSTDRDTWTTFADASASTIGAGLGFVLGDGIGGIDLDHCLVDGKPNKVAASFLETVPGHYIEVSPSGDGLHIFGTAEAALGSRKTIDGLHLERYSTGRYFTVTGNVFQHGDLLPL
jgi:primase-polymerase (primpol)-like protein